MRGFTRILSLAWVPLATSAVSLVLSVSSIVVSTREPEIVLILPDQVRVAQGDDFGFAYMYVQPAFVNTGINDRVEVLRTMTIEVQAPAGGGPTIFEWDERGELVYNADGSLSYRYLADAVPLLVSPRDAQVPFAVFNGPKGWYFGEGTYRMRLLAHRVVSRRPLEGTFEITFAQRDVDFLITGRGRRFLTFPSRKL
ncbi:MAG: hypothetical protein QN174_03350 [Armatimonadota bacterium]|nr:hypothetical protein [Armatimonadota bacterium]MDR7421571.1 hypothetical protein [Armatimonadota bacterium]MDR7454624.1 hypothetical protein [Armatimonadota bacterium]MDR7455980.1 hypothetical protein [Armatimonadota bacterium]MDR7495983.1 hypothetical protein [Armatimonadota bacterium]